MQRHVILRNGKTEPIRVAAGQNMGDQLARLDIGRVEPGIVAFIGVVAALFYADAKRRTLDVTAYRGQFYCVLPLLPAGKNA